MIAINVQLMNLPEVDAITKEVIDNIGKAVREQLMALVERILDDARSNLQNNQSIDSGELMESLQIFEIGSDYIEFGSEKFYAWFVEYGRGAVKPVNKSVLRFTTSSGDVVFSKYARPAPPKPFMEPAIIRQLNDFDTSLSNDDEIIPEKAK